MESFDKNLSFSVTNVGTTAGNENKYNFLVGNR